MSSSSADNPTREWVLEPETEYRFELDPGTTLAIKLLKGNAEVFGAELGEGILYLFGSECKAAVFTWQGCKLQMSAVPRGNIVIQLTTSARLHVTGKPSTEYVSDETPMVSYMNLHLAFEQMRVKASMAARNSPSLDIAQDVPDGPPRVLVLGPENAGKTTACKILANYAVRTGQGWAPMLVNVDPSEGGWTVPGTISACPITSPILTSSPANPLGSTATSAPTALSSSALLPIVFWFGRPEVRQNPILMERLVRNLGEHVGGRHDTDPIGYSSGVIVDTPSSFATGAAGAGSAQSNERKYSLVKACVDAFNINVVIVVGHEKLNVEMQRMFGQDLTVVKIPKSGGVVELDLGYRERIHQYQIHNYMYGQRLEPPPGLSSEATGASGGDDISADAGDLRLFPISSVIGFDDLTMYRIGGESIAPQDVLPVGATRLISEMQPIKIDPAAKGSGLLNAVLALLAPLNPDENERYDEEVLDLNVVAFLIVTALDMHNRKMTVLAPSPGSLTGRVALMGSFEWQDQ